MNDDASYSPPYSVKGWNNVKTERPPTGVSVLGMWKATLHVEDVIFYKVEGSDLLTYRTYDSDWVDGTVLEGVGELTHWMPIPIKGLGDE